MQRAVLSCLVAACALAGCAGEIGRIGGVAPGSVYRVPAPVASAPDASREVPPPAPSTAPAAEPAPRPAAPPAQIESAPAPPAAAEAPRPAAPPPPVVASPRPVTPAPAPVSPAAAPARDAAVRLRRLAAERGDAGPAVSYRIGSGDLLEVNVFDVAEMNRTVRVSQSGYIQLPLIGAVEAAGRSESGLSTEIARRLERDYVHNPQVDVFVAEYRSQQVAVTGAVAKPGLYPLTRERYTILDVLSEAGGLTEEAGAVVEFIPASSNGRSPAYEVASAGGALPLGPDGAGVVSRDTISIDLNDLLRGGNDTALNVQVVPGDVVFVPEAGGFTIEGWIDKPGTYGLTSKTTVLAALSAGGGPLLPAKLREVRILRNTRGTQAAREILEVDLQAIREGSAPDVPLRSGDIVRVPGRAVLMVPWGFYTLVQNLLRIGASVPLF